jgi:endoglucanase
VDVIAAFTVQEEIGARGAQIAAHRIDPDLVFVLETTTANDLPAEDDQDVSPVTELGKGPALSVMDRGVIYDKRLNDFLVGTAAALGIPVQFKRAATGGTDGGGIVTQRAGIPAAAISLPCRYLHSPHTLLDKRDYRNAIRLLEGALARLDRTVLAR